MAAIVNVDGQLKLGTAAVPSLRPGEVLIRVDYAGVNRPDVSQRKGLYPAPPGASEILGLEVSGTIAALSPQSSEQHSVGDQVFSRYQAV